MTVAPAKIRRQVEFKTHLLDWYAENMPPGTLWWFINQCLEQLKDQVEEGKLKHVNHYAVYPVKEIRRTQMNNVEQTAEE